MKQSRPRLLPQLLFLLLGAGLISLAFFWTFDASISHLQGVALGLGAGLVGVAISQLAAIFIYKRHPQLEEDKNIEVNDERNQSIMNQAKAKVFNLEGYILMAIMFGLLLFNIQTEILMSVLVYFVARIILQIYFVGHISKKI